LKNCIIVQLQVPPTALIIERTVPDYKRCTI
jgi:hypothetical protein